MSKLSDFIGGGGGLKPFNDLGTVTGTVNLDVSEFGSFRVKQGAGAITLNVTGKAEDTAGYVELFFYPNIEQAVTISGADLVKNGYKFLSQNIISLSYESLSFRFSAQETIPAGVAFNSDLSKMYMTGSITDSVYQYSLSDPGNISTASYDSVSLNVSSQDQQPMGIAFNDNQSKMYILGTREDSVFQYTLSTPGNLATASYDSVSFNIGFQEGQPRNINFNNDLSKMYILGASGFFQYTLSTPGSIATASYDSISFVMTGQDSSPQSITFTSDLSKMYMIGATSNSVYQYTLSTPGNISTASYDFIVFDVSSQVSNTVGIAFNNNESKIYITDSSGSFVYQYMVNYDLGPLFKYQIIHTGTAATFNTLNSDYTIEVAT